jgi:hypothetical protein
LNATALLPVRGALRTARPTFLQQSSSALTAGAWLSQLHVVENLRTVEPRTIFPLEEYDTLETQIHKDFSPDSLVFGLLFRGNPEVGDDCRQVVLSFD